MTEEEKKAEISFKAGREYEHKIMIGVAVDEGNKAFKDGMAAQLAKDKCFDFRVQKYGK